MIAEPACAETTKSFTVAATIANGCAVTTGAAGGSWGSIALGTVSGVGAGSVSATLVSGGTQGIELNCTPGVTASVVADQGDHSSGGVRQLGHSANVSSLVPYMLYANDSSAPWTNQAIALSFPVGTSRLQLPVRAVATLPSAVRSGAYSDTVRITVSW